MDNKIATKIEKPMQGGNATVQQGPAETAAAFNTTLNSKAGADGEEGKKQQPTETSIPYQIIVEEMPASVAIVSIEGLILYANLKLAELIGIPLDKLVNKNFTSLLKEEQAVTFKQLLKEQTNDRFTMDTTYLRADEKILSLQLSASRLPANMLGDHCIIIVDTTETKRAELELRQSLQSLEQKKAELIINNEKLSAANLAAVKLAENEVAAKIALEKSNKELIIEMEARTKSEKALKKNLELTNRIISSSKDSIKVLNLEGDLLLMSEGGQKILEIKDLSIYLNTPWVNFWKGEDKEKALNALSEARKGNIGRFEGFRATESGIPKWWEVVISPISDETGNIYRLLAISRDITQRIKYEEALSKSASNLRAIFDNAEEGYLLMDNDHMIVEYNSAMEKIMLAIENKQLQKNQNMLIDLPPEKQKTFLEQFNAVTNGGKFSFEKDCPQSNGSSIWLEIKLYPIINHEQSVIGVCMSMEDISKRKKNELEIIQAKEFHENLFNNSNAPIIIWDTKLNITRFNHAFELITGLSESSLIGKPITTIFPTSESQKSIDQIQQKLNGNNKESIEVEIANVDKSSRVLIWTTSVLFDEDGKTPLFTIAQGLDITERKKSESALKESEKLYRGLFDNMLNGFAYCQLLFEDSRPVDFIYLVANESFETQTGLKNVIGKKVSEIVPGIHEKDPKVLEIYSRVAITGKPEKFELFVNAMQAWYSVSSYSPQLNHFVIIFDDITERKKAESELAESEKRLQLTLETNQTGVWELNLADNNIFRTPTHDKIFGYEILLPKFTFENFTEHLFPADRDWVGKLISDSVAANKEYSFECRIRRVDGGIRWIFARGTPKLNSEGKTISVLGVVQDITERKNNDEALMKTENNLRSLFENTQVGYLLLDINYTVMEFNNLMARFFAIADKKTLKKNENVLNDLSKERQESLGKLLKAVMGGEKINYEVSYSQPDGKPIWLDARIYPITNKEGEAIGACISYEDITARKIAEKEIQELNKHLDKKVLERTAQYDSLNKELEAFTFSVSHDLRAPLRAVNSYAQILEEDQSDQLNEDGKAMLKNIKNNGQKMGRLIDDLLAFSRLGRQEIKRAQVNMNELTAAVVEELNKLFPNHASIQISPLPLIEGDYTLLYQVMFNLIGNAIKYSSKKEKPEITVCTEQKEGKTIFVIKDNGAGFDMRFADKLFGVFQRLHSEQEFEGNGVGLAIVQRIITKHGGKVWGEGKENEGASFYFTLN